MRADKIALSKKLELDLSRLRRDKQTATHQLSYLFWECTLRCNLNCLHCGSDCIATSDVKDMPADDFIKAIDTIAPQVIPEHTIIVFTGGEPLLRRDLEHVGLQLYKRRFPWGIVTNGYALTPQRLESLQHAGLCAITISLDGFQEAHNALRGNPNAFQQAMVALQALSKTTDLVWDVVTCVSPLNLSELPLFKEFLIQHGVKRWRIATIFPNGRAKENALLQLSDTQFKSVFDFIAHSRLEGRISVSYGCEGFLGAYENEVRNTPFFCRAGVNVASILVDGSISGCTSIRSNFTQGNIYHDNFMEVWNNRFQRFRDRRWTKKDECLTCKQYRYCLGNGLHLYDENFNLAFCHYNRLVRAEK